MASNTKKLCYILPEYDKKTATHFAHLFDFIGELSNEFELIVIIERASEGAKDIYFGTAKIEVVKSRFLPLRIIETAIRLKKARFSGYSDFYVHYSFLSAFIASLIVRIFGGRVYYWNCGEPWKYRRNIFRDIFEKFTYKIITYLVTGTESLKKEYAKHYGLPPEKIKVMPNWINLQKFRIMNYELGIKELKEKLSIKEGEKIILFAHRLSRRKGAHYLPEIIKAFRDEKVVFVIIGDGPERENLELRIKNYELGKKVRLLGWLPNKELPFYYSIADIFLMPSEEEGFPRVLLEAMAMKVPFVASDVGGVKEIIPIELGGFICLIGEIDCFVSKIKNLLQKKREEIEEIKKTEYGQAEVFSLKNSLEIFKNFFK